MGLIHNLKRRFSKFLLCVLVVTENSEGFLTNEIIPSCRIDPNQSRG